MAIQFLDEIGDPMAAGVEVSVYPAGGPQNASTLVGTDWTQAGGLCPNIALETATSYIAVFVGRQGPTGTVAFIGDGNDTTVVTVSPYRSPSLTTANYAALQAAGLWPKGPAWWSDVARAVGGIAWALAYAFGAIWQFLDTAAQQRLQAARLQSAAGADVDSWAYDFLGQWIPRYDGEGDQSFKRRIIAALAAPKTTLAAIANIVDAFYNAVGAESETGALAFDNNLGGFDLDRGGFDLLSGAAEGAPSVYVWDHQSRPDLDTLYQISEHFGVGWFVIQIGFSLTNESAWYLDYESVDYNSYLLDIDQWDASLTPPDPRLGALVDFVKAGGSKPVYLTTLLTP